MKLSTYSKYKPSGIEWLGDVPSQWEIVPLKYRCRRTALYGANIPGEAYASEGVRFLRTTDIDDFGTLQPGGVFIEPEQAEGYVLADGDILMSRSGTIGRAFVYSSHQHPKSAYAGYLVRFVPSPRLSPALVFYFTKSTAFRDWLDTQVIASTIGNVNGQKYAQCPLPLPDRQEQDEIVNFLDREALKIDTLVGKKQMLINLLKEKRVSLISRTVTRGLPPEVARAAGFDPHPAFISSGIDWLGDVSKHWDVAQLRRKCTILDCMHRTVSFIDEGIPLASIREVHGFEVDLSDAKRTTEEEYLGLLEGGRRPRVGDIIYSRNATVGEAAIVAKMERFAMGQDVCLLRSEEQDPKYLLYLLRSQSLVQQLESFMVGATFRRINVGQIRTFLACWPPVDEQRAIGEFLDRETAKIDKMVAKIETAIERLQEYRTALITAAVTGKIDVRRQTVDNALEPATAS